MKREFLLLAHQYEDGKINPAGWFVSTKLDGVRCFWDSGASRGIPADEVPYANITKDGRYIEKQIATGLWTRYGKVIHAPDSFLDQLPTTHLLDGELYAGRGLFQQTISTIKTLVPDPQAWKSIKYMVFDSPPVSTIFSNGEINNTNFKKTLIDAMFWVLKRNDNLKTGASDFKTIYGKLQSEVEWNDQIVLHEQIQLPSKAKLMDMLDLETSLGGEGLMIRNPKSYWVPGRSHDLLKIKRMQDAEGIVVGYTAGKETDKGSKLLGLMGSLKLRLENGKEFDLSGFTDSEREMALIPRIFDLPFTHMVIQKDARAYLEKIPGEIVDNRIVYNPKFPIGSSVTFRYREYTDEGLPKEARYWRKSSN